MTSLRQLLAGHPTFVVTADLTDEAIARLREIGPVILLGWAADEDFVPEEILKSALADADVLVIGYEPITASLLEAAPHLRLIASLRGDPRVNVDVTAATEHGIPVLCAPGRTNEAVAEFTLMLILAMVRKLLPALQFMRRRPDGFVPSEPQYRRVTWGAPPPTHIAFRGVELSSLSLGIVGLGGIGRAVARKATALGMYVRGTDPFPTREASQVVAELVSLDDLLTRSDVVSIHAALTPSTRGLLGERELSQMKDGAYLVNTARSSIVDRHALLDALTSGRLAGAALDVYDQEPPELDDPLVGHVRVLATPHIAAWTTGVSSHHSQMLLDDIDRIRHGRLPQHLANPDVIAVGVPAREPIGT